MANLDLVQRHLFASAALAGLLLGGIAGLFFPIRAAPPIKAGAEDWAMPTLAETSRFSEKAFIDLRSARYWKSVAGPGQRSAATVDWKLTAIITRPRLLASVSSARAKPSSMLVPVGAELPDGSTLLRMTRDAVWFEKDGCIRERRLFRAVTAENNACINGAEPGQAGAPPPPAPANAPGRPGNAAGDPRPVAPSASSASGSASP